MFNNLNTPFTVNKQHQKNVNISTAPPANNPNAALKKIISLRKKLEKELILPQTKTDLNRKKEIYIELNNLREAVDNDSALRVLEYKKNFDKWLIGKGVETDHVKTAWYRTPLIDLPGVAKYLSHKVSERYDLLAKLQILKLNGATDLVSAQLYYKYIVNGKDDEIYDDLDEWIMQENQYEEEYKLYGEELADKLNSYTITKKSIVPEWKAISSDLEDYVRLNSEADPDTRKILKTKFNRKNELFVELMNYSNITEIHKLMHEYVSNTKDLDSILAAQFITIEELKTKRHNLISRFTETAIYNPQLYENDNTQALFTAKVIEYDNRIEQLTEKADELYTKFKTEDDQTFGKRILPVNNMLAKPAEPTVPKLLQQILDDEAPSDEDVLNYFIELWGLLLTTVESFIYTLNNCTIYIQTNENHMKNIDKFILSLSNFLHELSRRDIIQHDHKTQQLDELLGRINLDV